MVILQSHRTQNMILRFYPNVAICYTSETYHILSSVFFNNPYISPFNSQNLLVSDLFLHALQYYKSIQAGLCSAQNMAIYLVWITWGIKCAYGACG